MAQPASMAYAAKLGMGVTSTITEGYELINETLTGQHEHVETDGIRGTRARQSETVADGRIRVSGSVEFTPSLSTIANILPRILGAAASGVSPTTYKLADVLPYFWIMIDKVAKVHLFDHCKVNKATLKSSPGKRLSIVLDVVGFAETITNAGTFTGGITVPIEQPYMHHQGVFTFNAIARNVEEHTLTIDNKLLTDEFRNSQTVQVIPEGDRVITLETKTPWTSDETDLLTLALAGVPGTIVYTNGSNVLTITFGRLQAPPKTPNVPGLGQQIPLMTNFNARKLGTVAGTTDEIVVTQ